MEWVLMAEKEFSGSMLGPARENPRSHGTHTIHSSAGRHSVSPAKPPHHRVSLSPCCCLSNRAFHLASL